MPCLPTVDFIKEEKKQLVLTGQLNIGEPCAPYLIKKSVVTKEAQVEFQSVQICGRKIPLYDIRAALLEKHEQYMRLLTKEEIKSMGREEVIASMSAIHHEPPPDASLVQLQDALLTLQRTRTIALWHDHSTILQTGYIMFAVWIVYDAAVFITQDEWVQKQPRATTNIQSLIEEPSIYMIAPSSSSPADQLALVGDRLECLHELSKPVVTSNGLEIEDCLRFFCGDKPAQHFERGTQIGGTYKCGRCGCKDSMMQDLAHAFHHSWRSLSDLQSLILAGTLGNKPRGLKPFEELNVYDL